MDSDQSGYAELYKGMQPGHAEKANACFRELALKVKEIARQVESGKLARSDFRDRARAAEAEMVKELHASLGREPAESLLQRIYRKFSGIEA